MGSLFLEIGQCGCQIGNELNPLLSTSYYSTRIQPPHRLHTIMLDTQPKVLQSLIDKPPKWLDPQNVRAFEYGRGNNWSYGYLHKLPPKLHQQFIPKRQFSHKNNEGEFMQRYLTENKHIAKYTVDTIRKELETVDCALAINVLCSLGGGTGSGLGTRLVEQIHQEFALDIFSHLILPNRTGETPLQVYNCCLSLASLQQHCTALFTYENEDLVACSELREDSDGSLKQVNRALANSIARMIRLNDLQTYPRMYSEIVAKCVVSPQANYVTLLGSEGLNWDTTFEQLHSQLKVLSGDNEIDRKYGTLQKEKLIAGELILLGKKEAEYMQKYDKKTRLLLSPLVSESLNWEQIIGKEESECMLLMNHSRIGRYLSYLNCCGRSKFEAKAYLWHYQYADLESAFENISRVIDQYHYFTHA